MRVISGIHSGAMFMNLVTAIIIYLNCELCTTVVVASDQVLIENVTTHGPVLGFERSIEITSEIPLTTTVHVNTTIGNFRSSTTTESTLKPSTEDEKETTAAAVTSSAAQPAMTESSVTFSTLDVSQQQSGINMTTMATPIGINTTENIDNPVIITGGEDKSSGCSTAKRKR
jgi:hypothetical protein